MSWNLANRVAVVSGLSGSIGRAVTTSLLQHGVKVYGTSRISDDDELVKLKNSFIEVPALIADSSSCQQPLLRGIFTCDMETEKSCEDCIKKIMIAMSSETENKHIDLFVNCAGVTQNKLLARTTADDLMRMYFANTIAPVLMAKNILRYGGMVTRKEGCLIALGSVVGEDGNAGQVSYSASKGALTSSWKSLAKEYGPRGIRFNVVSPGLVESTMAESISEEKKRMWCDNSALGRLVTVEEIAETVVGCAKCSGMTGQVLRVDCGMR